MQKLQDSVFSIVKRTSLSAAVFSFLQPSEENPDRTPLGQILSDTKHAWLALGPKFCVIDLRTGLKVAARHFGSANGHTQVSVSSVVELPTPLSNNSQQLIISLQCDDGTGMICVLHINGSQILRCIQTEVVVTQISVCDDVPDGPFSCYDGVVMAGTKNGEIFVFDLYRASLIQALKDISQGYEHLVQSEQNPANLTFLPLSALHRLEEHRDLAIENEHHIAVLLNENSLVHSQYLFRNPDGSVCMKAKREQIRVTALQYIPQLGSLAVGYNFGAFQIWNMITMDLEFTSQVNVECLPVTHFGFQEPCDDPRAFCYIWVVFSVLDRLEEEEFPLAVMYSLTYHGKRMLSDAKCLYQDFSMATLRFQVDLASMEESVPAVGGKCVSCHTYTVNSTLGEEGEDSMLNICQLVWEVWGENSNVAPQYGMIVFDLDQWYKDQMPSTCRLESSPFMSAHSMGELAAGSALDARLAPHTVTPYSHATRLEEHFYPNSWQYECTWLSTSEWCVSRTLGIQRQVLSALASGGPAALLHPATLYKAARAAGLAPLLADYTPCVTPEDQRRFLLSLCAEARLSRVLRRAARDWATHTHAGAGCTLHFLVDWCWTRAIDLKEYAKELTAPLFISSSLPDRNVVRCLEHCVQQLIQLAGLLDAILTKCCNLVVPDALSEMEEKHKGISTVSLYFQVVQWFLRVGLLPERGDGSPTLPYPADQIRSLYDKRRLKLQRLQENAPVDDKINKPCSLLYIDQLIENEFDGERVREMWMRGGSESYGLYPPPSLYSLLRLYLVPEIAEEHKHSLVLYLLLDYSMVYDEVRYEAVIRRLMQFPTMFGLSNTAIKATQAFWHLDHRDFDFALDQLQCLTGNTLSDWQHSVVLSSLLAQKKMQAALQYLHVRKPAPAQNMKGSISACKLTDWQASCNLYLARQLLAEAIDVVRVCAEYSASREERESVLNFFFRGCRNTGQLSKVLQLPLLPFEEEVFIKYLQDCDEPQTSDILIMYYLQQARYLEAEQYNNKLKQKSKRKDLAQSAESLADMIDRESARDTLVSVVCESLPTIATNVAKCAFTERDLMPHVIAPKPMSVFVKAKSPKNTFTYKSSFIQDTIENASETWVNKPRMRRGIKRALQVEETPFICTPKLSRTRSVFADQPSDSATPSKRSKMDDSVRTPRDSAVKVSAELSRQMRTLLDMPEVHTPEKLYSRSGAGTPHSILKIKRELGDRDRDVASPTDSRYLGDSDDELAETASNHTHYSDANNRHLRFTIPTASESGSTPSPEQLDASESDILAASSAKETDNFIAPTHTTPTHPMTDSHELESPPKKQATEERMSTKKLYKDTVRARRSLSISANSSLSDDPNTSIESIADIPITLVNPRYCGERRRSDLLHTDTQEKQETETRDTQESGKEIEIPKTPKGRRGIRAVSRESTPLLIRSRSVTPERVDSPISPARAGRSTRSKSRTPERSPRSSPLAPIPEQPKQEVESEQHPKKSLLSISRQLRSRSRTPERADKSVKESPRLAAITESPTKLPAEPAQPQRRARRSRSRTPEVEVPAESPKPASPRSLRTRAKTPEKIMSPKIEHSAKGKKSLSRLVLEANAFAKTKGNVEKDSENDEESVKSDAALECTPIKTLKQMPSLLDSTLSPIVNKSVLQSSNDSVLSETIDKDPKTDKNVTDLGLKPLPAFTTLHESYFEKSVLRSNQSSINDSSETTQEVREVEVSQNVTDLGLKPLPAFTTLHESYFDKSVLRSDQSSINDSSETTQEVKEVEVSQNVTDLGLKPLPAFTTLHESYFDKSVLRSDQSSINESSETTQEVKEVEVSQNVTDLGLKPLPAFTTLHESYFDKSVLRSDQSSINDSSETPQEVKGVEVSHEKNVGMKTLPAFTTIHDIEFDKSVLHSYQSSIDESTQSMQETTKNDEKVLKPLSAFTPITDAEFKPVLGSVESSLAGTSQEASKNKTDYKNMSSLMTSDSDIEMNDDKKDSAQKEKERIVEIEREINEIEEDMSDSDNEESEEEDEGDAVAEESAEEEVAVAEESVEEEEESEPSHEESSNDTSEVISINDTDTEDSSSSGDRLQIDEESSKDSNLESEPKETIVQVIVERDDDEEEKETTDPMNQGQFSLLTDDNSEHSNMDLNYSDEKKESETIKPMHAVETIEIEEVPKDVNETVEDIKVVVKEPEDSADKQEPMETDEEPATQIVIEEIVTTETTGPVTKIITEVTEVTNIPVVDTVEDKTEATSTVLKESENIQDYKNVSPEVATESKQSDVPMETENVPDKSKTTRDVVIESKDRSKKAEVTTIVNPNPEIINTETKDENLVIKPARISKRTKSTSSNKSETESKVKPIEEHKTKSEVSQTVEESNEGKPVEEEAKTPSRRKRAQSTASNKSTDDKTPENDGSKTRSKTPSSEVRRIMTRRASKEILEKMDDSKEILDKSVVATPKRRTTRSRSKNIDDNESVASEGSVRSTRSRASEASETSEVKAAPIRKGRKSILATKTDLSVIPETTVEESTSEKIISDYSKARRLTRNQKAMLESWLEPAPSPSPRRGRRPSAVSSASAVSEQERDDDDVSSTHSDATTMDRIALMDKAEFDGSPDRDEFPPGSPDSLATNAAPKPRLARAASESRSTPKAAKVSRRISVDIAAAIPEHGSPARGRRASFNRACEALHTPKGRRTSTDSRKGETESPQSPGSPMPEGTPARRARRASSASTPSLKPDAGKRTRKTPAVEETKDTKKK